MTESSGNDREERRRGLPLEAASRITGLVTSVMDLHVRIALKEVDREKRRLIVGVLLLGAGAGFSKPQKAAGGGAQVDALSRLTLAQRSEYIQGLRSIEQSRSSERLQQLDQAQTCLAQAANPTAVKSCWQNFVSASQKSRAEQAQQWQALAERLGLPAAGKKKQ